ncbi:MAG: DUF924 family protein [Nevskiales bacterium]
MIAVPTQAILELWFGDGLAQPARLTEVAGRWFEAHPQFDQSLRERYASLLATVVRETPWQGAIDETLARVLLLDQFSRNIHRGQAAAFAYDASAQALMRGAIDAGTDTALPPIGRSFLYMPLQHAEDPALQRESVQRFTALVAEARHPAERKLLSGSADYARLHADIIERFGRFPHRNALLDRPSDPAERAYLESGAPRFGQS